MVLAAQVLVKEIRMERKPAPIEIALRDVSVSYPLSPTGRKTVLSNLNLDIDCGEFVAVLGETGCGKSTLLRLVLGQEFPTRGSIVVDGKQVTRIDSRCGYVPQKYSLFPDNHDRERHVRSRKRLLRLVGQVASILSKIQTQPSF